MAPETPIEDAPAIHSCTMSSCELFTMLKAIAKGKRDEPAELDRSLSGTTAVDLIDAMNQANAEKFAAISLDQEGGEPLKKERPTLDMTQPSVCADPSDKAAEPADDIKLAAIQEEFGVVAEEPEVEKMLASTVAIMFKGIMMVGNAHLTTHRLLFHAPLPPDEAYVSKDIGDFSKPVGHGHLVHSGPVTWHRSGVHAAQRVWLELSAEMLSTYPSADDAGRTRPLRSILLAAIHRLEPIDDEHPSDFRITYEAQDALHSAHFTVDTEQSAVQWRRDLESALYRLLRLNWREHVTSGGELMDGSDEWSMLRYCVPLDRLTVNGISDYHGFSRIVSMDVELDKGQRTLFAPERVAEGDYHGATMAGLPTSMPTASKRLSLKLGRKSSGSRSPARSEHSHEHTRHLSPLHPSHLCHVLIPRRGTPSETPASTDSSDHESTPSTPELAPEADNTFNFNIVLLNDWSWFGEALETAVAAAHRRELAPGRTRPSVVLNIGGMNGLATDEEIDAAAADARASRQESMDSAAEAVEEGQKGAGLVKAARKAQRAHLAARAFGLKEEEGIWLKRGYVIHGGVPMRGHVILTPRYVCFWRRMLMSPDIKYRFKSADIKGVVPVSDNVQPACGIALQLHGRHDVHFDFWKQSARDEVVERIQALIDAKPSSDAPITSPISLTPTHAADILAPTRDALFKRRTLPDHVIPQLPFLANKPWLSRTATLSPRTFTCLTIGSRGDVQPYIALGVRLMRDGHKVVIVTHDEFKGWIEGYGIEHRQAGGDPTALMTLSAQHAMLSPGFFKESLGSFKAWFDELLVDAWKACQDADVLIESPSAMAGIHIAEALKIPYFRAFTMPWNRTSAYPQAFMVPAFDMGPQFNYSTYTLFDNIMWTASAPQINRWRKAHLGLAPTNMAQMSPRQVPFLYNFSEAVVPKPLDWTDAISITGYWTLEDSDRDWTPPAALEEWLAKAKKDGKMVVYIGFGSIVVPKPGALTRNIIAAVEKAGVRAVVAKGWSSRGSKEDEEEVEFPESCYNLDKVPHGWLFPRIDAAMHHGGAGTTGASLRAGLPTIIKPFFGDQYFWALRVGKLGVGLKAASFKVEDIADALTRATTDRVMREKAARVGKQIRAECGVDVAVQTIQYNIVRAASDRRELSFAK